MSSSFDLVGLALATLETKIPPEDDQARRLILYMGRIIDWWHDCHHKGDEALNRVPWERTKGLELALTYADPEEFSLRAGAFEVGEEAEVMVYPSYWVEVFDYVQDKWVQVAHVEVSNRPHHYDRCRQEWQRLVASAQEEASPNQKPIGYRIMRSTTGVVDGWDNGKLPRPGNW